jgi:membrane-bound lytic murein transglycosylase B
MTGERRKFFLVCAGLALLATVVVSMPRGASAQTDPNAQASSDATKSPSGGDVAAKRAALQAQLDQLNTEIAQTQNTLTGLHNQHSSLQNQINILNAQIKKAQLQLQATKLQISALQQNIVIHSNTINVLSGKLSSEQQTLGQILRHTDEIDHSSLVAVALSAKDVSSFFGDLDSFSLIKSELGTSYTQTTDTRTQKQNEKLALEDQQTQAQQLAREQALEEQQIKDSQAQKQQLLTQTKGQEATYQSIYNIQKQTIAQIRAALFALAGGSGSISLPNAIALAKQAGAAVGVRPALILGILKQETNIGQNLGVGVWSVDMSPTRDVPVFKVIMANLGLDPNSVKISRAQSGGWGGAMGPGQFIPSTWACYGGYVNATTGSCGKGTDGTYAGPWSYSASKDRVARLAGHPGTPSNPYNNLDAFTATAMLMADNGATSQTPAAERLATLRYYAGWGGASNPAYAFYGDGVMGFAAQFQSDIDTLSGK